MPKNPNVVDVLKPVFGKTEPRTKLRAIRKEITAKEFEKRASAVLKAWEADRISAKEFGHALIGLKDSFYTHGFFTKWLRANGIDQNRASYCMRVALNKVKEAQKKRKVYVTTLIKKDVDELLRIATRKAETREQIATRIGKIVRDLCHGVGKAAGWQRNKDKQGNKINAMGDALMKALDDVLDAMYVTYELDENGNIVQRDTGRVFSDVGSALGAQEAAASAGS